MHLSLFSLLPLTILTLFHFSATQPIYPKQPFMKPEKEARIEEGEKYISPLHFTEPTWCKLPINIYGSPRLTLTLRQ